MLSNATPLRARRPGSSAKAEISVTSVPVSVVVDTPRIATPAAYTLCTPIAAAATPSRSSRAVEGSRITEASSSASMASSIHGASWFCRRRERRSGGTDTATPTQKPISEEMGP
jgi:hypothetical protein